MIALMIEIAGYLGAAALIGLIIGYLLWGWGQRRRVENARAEGAAAVRTSVDGDGLRGQVETLQRDNARLERRIEHLQSQPETETVTELAPAVPAEPVQATATTATTVQEPPAPVPDIEPAPQPRISALAPRRSRNEPRPEPVPDQLGTIRARFADTSHMDMEEEAARLEDLDPIAGIEPDFDYAAEDTRPAHSDPAMPDIAQSDQAAGHVTDPGSLPSILLSQRPAEVDDLKRIKGVGGKMERILNDKGVYQFRQIAAFSDTDIEWVNEAIDAFPGRIQRDDWVGQARDLHMEKYGRAHDEEQA